MLRTDTAAEAAITEWIGEHISLTAVVEGSEPLFVDLLRRQGLPPRHIAAVLLVLDAVCQQCWDAPRGCECKEGGDDGGI